MFEWLIFFFCNHDEVIIGRKREMDKVFDAWRVPFSTGRRDAESHPSFYPFSILSFDMLFSLFLFLAITPFVVARFLCDKRTNQQARIHPPQSTGIYVLVYIQHGCMWEIQCEFLNEFHRQDLFYFFFLLYLEFQVDWSF